MDQLSKAFLQDCEVRGMSPRSLPGYKSALKMYGQYLDSNGFEVLQADRKALRGFIEYMRAERQVSQRTIELVFSVMSSFYDYLVFEGQLAVNPVLPIRKRYLRRYKDNGDGQERQLISIEEMTRMINSTLEVRDKAVITLLAKTGIRRHELIELDVADVDLIENRVRLKPTAKRTNRTVFFDDECSFILRRWLRVREGVNKRKLPALFLSTWGNRISRNDVYLAVTKAAERVGLHNASSKRLEDHFSPHCCRHWNTTHLLRAGMKREYVQWLRGDAIKEAVDIYFHIDPKDVQEAYLACIPQLGI
ncbi:MAG: tyrosine-type recombinase/integrase [Methanotrichaceae archaeon]|nr:tyrosine-type recombinase/integrase [Methanotrichaceae archaeon]